MNCKCQNCPGTIDFLADRAGETVLCPHCQLETVLFLPVRPSRLKETPAPEPKSALVAAPFLIEDNLQSIGNTFFGLGLAGGVISFILVIWSAAESSNAGEFMWWMLPAILVSVAQGWIVRAVFHGLAEIIRQLRQLNSAQR